MKVFLWMLYALFGIICVLFALLTTSPWFSLALAIAFIFGPKIWRQT